MSWAAQIDSLKTELQARMAVLRTQVLDLIGAMEIEMSEQLDLLLAEARQREQASSRDGSDEQGAVEDRRTAATSGNAGPSGSTDDLGGNAGGAGPSAGSRSAIKEVCFSKWRFPVIDNKANLPKGWILKIDPAKPHKVRTVQTKKLGKLVLAMSVLYPVRSEREMPEGFDIGKQLTTHTCQPGGELYVQVAGFGVVPLEYVENKNKMVYFHRRVWVYDDEHHTLTLNEQQP